MSERYADLSPISCSEYEAIGQSAFKFFNPIENRKIRQQMGFTLKEKLVPLSGCEFLTFLRHYDEEYDRKVYKIRRILSLMERAELLTFEGHGANAILGSHYYTLKELTTLQRTNTLWLGEAFGFPYLQEKLSPNVIHITGRDNTECVGNGTGFLINNQTVLTCKHVVTDMTPDEHLNILGGEYTYSIKKSETYDIALLILDRAVDSINSFPVFNVAEVLDEVLIMGYPPIIGADSDYMLSQKGEVNSVVYDYLSKTTNLVLSSVTRPGNSGGPVISKSGYLVGMVTQFNVSAESKAVSSEDVQDNGEDLSDDDNGENRFPFYIAMHGRTLFDGIKEIDPEIEINFEDYQ